MNQQSVFRILLWVFGFVLLVFMIVPVLHCLRGHSIKDYWVWYRDGAVGFAGRRNLSGSVARNFRSCIRRRARCFSRRSAALGQTGLIDRARAGQRRGLVLQHHFFGPPRHRGMATRGHCPSLSCSELCHGSACLGKFSSGTTEPASCSRSCWARLFRFSENRNVIGGGLIAIAAAIKAFPVMAIVYLVYRRYWIGGRSLMPDAARSCSIVLPIPFRGYDPAKQDLERWSSGMLFKYDESGRGPTARAKHLLEKPVDLGRGEPASAPCRIRSQVRTAQAGLRECRRSRFRDREPNHPGVRRWRWASLSLAVMPRSATADAGDGRDRVRAPAFLDPRLSPRSRSATCSSGCSIR